MSSSPYLYSPNTAAGVETGDISSKKPRILPLYIAATLSTIAGFSAYFGSSQYRFLIPDAAIAAIITALSVFLLLIPFMILRREAYEVLSPEIMGAIGYFIYLGIGIVTNYTWPGYAVNPSLFRYLPCGVILQTIGALAFFGGAYWARRFGSRLPPKKNILYRLAFILILYASFSFYITFLTPRADALDLLAQTRSGEPVSWIHSVGLYIVFQSSPMLIAAWVYLRNTKFRAISYIVIAVYTVTTIIFFISGSRTYATQLLLLYLVSYFLAGQKVSKRLVFIAASTSFIVLVFSTSLRVLDEFVVSLNPATMEVEDVGIRIQSSYMALGDQNQYLHILENIRQNIVYHLSDNQTMAYLVRNSNEGHLYGKTIFRSFLSGLPRQLRPSDYYSATNTIMDHYQMYKERAIAAPLYPDWQMSIGIMGYADFGFVGLLLYPFILGIIVRCIYTVTVIKEGFGKAGWLIYAPIVFLLWNPLLLGPDSVQVSRMIIILALLMFWSIKRPSI